MPFLALRVIHPIRNRVEAPITARLDPRDSCSVKGSTAFHVDRDAGEFGVQTSGLALLMFEVGNDATPDEKGQANRYDAVPRK